MKTFLKAFMMGALVFTIASCGGENESSGGSSSSSSSGGTSSSGSDLKNYDQVKNTFTKMSAASGLINNDVVYHTGPAYGMQTQQVDFDFDIDLNFGFCFNWFGDLKGDCDAYENQQPSYSQLSYIVDNGEYKVIRDRSTNEVDFDLAIGSSNNTFDYDRRVFDRNAAIYRAMLNLDNKTLRGVVVSDAQIVITEGNYDPNNSNTKQRTIKGNLVEYFFEDGTIEGYVLSNAFPLIANPILIAEGSDYGYFAAPLRTTGVLNFSGVKTIRSISANTHYLEYDVRLNKYVSRRTGQQLRLSF